MAVNENKALSRWVLRIFWWIFKFALAALFIAIPIRWFVAQPFLVAGPSMEPTFQQNQYLVIDKLYYHYHKPERGDIIIMRYPLDPSMYFVKRIIGLPGETISVSNGSITIASAEATTTLQEPYLGTKIDKTENSTTTLAGDEYFVLGDNRTQSSDSREWGPLQAKFIVGRAYARLFPLGEMQLLPGQYRYTSP